MAAQKGLTRPGQRFADAVYALVKQIPKGQVATYSQVGTYLGSPRLARAVGNALRGLSSSQQHDIPWHRVIKSDGMVAGKGDFRRPPKQVKLLRAEGIPVELGVPVPLEIFGWAGPRKQVLADFGKSAGKLARQRAEPRSRSTRK